MFWGHNMILFFNLDNLELEATGNPNKFMQLLNDHRLKKLPKLTVKRKLTGKSFIIHPEPLFEINNVDILYKIQYIKLAARRDYAHYKLYNSRVLDISFFPDLNIAALRSNPLLKITNKHIQFLYEEKDTKWH
jgi:hypothetical protein